MRRLLPVLVPLLVGSSCGSDPDDFSRCSPPLALTVTQQPLSFSWSPADCDVNTLSVLQGQKVKWHIAANPDQNSIEGPIRYGVPPEGVDAANADSLVVGPYTLQVTRLSPDRMVYEVSDQDFTFVSPAQDVSLFLSGLRSDVPF